MKKTIICGAVLVASIIPALADQYWVVQDSTSSPRSRQRPQRPLWGLSRSKLGQKPRIQ
jgi:hypothetical protein